MKVIVVLNDGIWTSGYLSKIEVEAHDVVIVHVDYDRFHGGSVAMTKRIQSKDIKEMKIERM